MRFALSRFADLLRREGLRVSTGELIDAGHALQGIDLGDREALRSTLRATLAKRREEIAELDRVFDRFFVPPPMRSVSRRRRKRRGGAGEPAEGETQPGGAGSGAARTRGGAQGGGAAGASGGRVGATPHDAAKGVIANRQETLRKLDRATAAPTKARFPSRVIQAPHRARDRARTADRPRGGPVSPDRPRDGDRRGLGAGARFDERRRPGRSAHSGPARQTLPIARKSFRDRWSDLDAEALSHEISRVLSQLRLRRTRRRRAGRRGALWAQRTTRRNLAHDGVPFRLVRRSHAEREPHLLLLVDVSHSVARAAAAFLALSTNLARTFRRVRVFLFVDRAADVTRDLPRLAHIEGRTDALDRVIAAYPDLNPTALSDYGRVLYQVLESEKRRVRKDTVLLILGDARSNWFDPCEWVLESLASRIHRTVWLVPEPIERWDEGDSVVSRYAPHCDAVCEAADLEGLRHSLRHAFSPR